MRQLFLLLVGSAAAEHASRRYDFWAHLSAQEWAAQYLGLKTPLRTEPPAPLLSSPFRSVNLPAEFDWRKKMPKCLHAVRAQGRCGSCWAHSASEVFSTRACIQSGGTQTPEFSPQQLVDCEVLLDKGCAGGSLFAPFFYYALVGAQEESCYGAYTSGDPAAPKRPYCFLKKWACPVHQADMQSMKWLHTPEAIKEELFSGGPVNVGFLVYDDFPHYLSGVYEKTSDVVLGGHAVMIVGWGQDAGGEHWVVQNSWGAHWGEEGFFRIRFGECYIDLNGISIDPRFTPAAPPA